MKETHVRYNDKVYEAIKNYCGDHNLSVNALQNLASAWFLTMKKYLIFKPQPVLITTEKISTPPQEIMYCDGDKCELQGLPKADS